MKTKNKQNEISAYGGGLAYFCMIATFVIITFLGQTVCAVIFEPNSVAYIAVCSTFSALSMLGVIIYCAGKVDKPCENLFSLKKFNPLYICLAILLSLGMFLGLGFINTAFINLLKALKLSVSSTVIPLENAYHLILFSFVLALIPAVVEELFFRGVLLSSLNKAKTFIAVIVVAVCFALYHCSLAQLVYQLIYGILLSLLVKVSSSVIPAIISHFVNNFAVLFLEFFKIEINLFNPLIIALGVMLIAIFTVIVCLRLKTQDKLEVKKGEIKDFFVPCGIFGLAICLTLTISTVLLGA